MSRNKKMSKSTDKRIQNVLESSTIYYWSIQNEKIIRLNNGNFKKGRHQCQCCIPLYSAKKGHMINHCKGHFDSLLRFKQHLISICENNYKRPLVWVKKSDVPDDVRRHREIGDLSGLEDEEILRLEFGSKTVVNYLSELLIYFRLNGCHCMDEFNLKCTVKLAIGKRWLLSHLSGCERKFRKYIVFKGYPNKITENKTENSNAKLNVPRIAYNRKPETTLQSYIQSLVPYIPLINSRNSSKEFGENKNSCKENSCPPDPSTDRDEYKISFETVQFAVSALHASLNRAENCFALCNVNSSPLVRNGDDRRPLSSVNFDSKAKPFSSQYDVIDSMDQCPANIFDVKNILDDSSDLIDEFFRYSIDLFDPSDDEFEKN